MENFFDGFEDLFLFRIPLRNRMREIIAYAIVSEEDFYRVSMIMWYLHFGYARHNKHGMMHRFILGLEKDDETKVDHIDGDGLDNRRENLRFATMTENAQNRTKQKETSSQYRGVSWHKRIRKWAIQINTGGGNRHLGYHTDEEKAARRYDKEAIKSGSDFWRLNFSYTEEEIQAILAEEE